MDSKTTTKVRWTGVHSDCPQKEQVRRASQTAYQLPGCKSIRNTVQSGAEQSSCPDTSSNRAENIPTPVLLNPVYFMLLRGFKETELLFKSALTKKLLKSIKINYFEVFFTNTPPAFPFFPICYSTEPNCDYIYLTYKLGRLSTQADLAAARAECIN